VAFVALALAIAAPALVRRIRRRAAHGSPERELARLWRHSLDSLDHVGVPVAPSQTPLETAAATARQFPIAARPVALLADAVTNATYAADGTEGFDDVGEYGLSTMRSCRNWVRQIDRAVLESVPWHERLRRYFTDWG
jgi:hypothetical protein